MELDVTLAWVLWLAGIVAIALAAYNARAPYARMQELDRLAENSRRYDSWRGGRRTAADEGTSGADVMHQMVRRRVLTWVGVAGAGLLLILAGFFVR